MPASRPLSSRRKVLELPALTTHVRYLRRQGKTVVFANGCFDLLHVGHVALLERAKQLGDVLIVAINSDRSARKLKGPSRPLLAQADRATMLAALESVDYVTVFDEPTPYRFISTLEPDVLIKGADWSAGEIVGSDVVKRRGGRVVRVPLVSGFSTTQLAQRIARHAKPRKPAPRV